MSELHIMTDIVPSAPPFKTGVGGGGGGGGGDSETPQLKRRSLGSSCSSSLVSPETEEFESLEKSFREELQQKLHERKISEAERKNSDLSSGRRLSELSSKTRKDIEIILSKHWNTIILTLVEPGKYFHFWYCSDEDPLSLQLVEKRQLRSFSRADEYLYAMKEDLAEWLNMLYPTINVDAENFMDCLQTGEHLLRVSRVWSRYLW